MRVKKFIESFYSMALFGRNLDKSERFGGKIYEVLNGIGVTLDEYEDDVLFRVVAAHGLEFRFVNGENEAVIIVRVDDTVVNHKFVRQTPPKEIPMNPPFDNDHIVDEGNYSWISTKRVTGVYPMAGGASCLLCPMS